MVQLTLLLKALSDRNRLRILKMLEIRALCVCEITDILGLATSTVSKHLSILKENHLITDRKEGKWIYYERLPERSDVVSDVLDQLNDKEQIKRDAEQVHSSSILCKTVER